METLYPAMFSYSGRGVILDIGAGLSRIFKIFQISQEMSRIFKIFQMSRITFYLQWQCSCESDSVPNACRTRDAVSLNGDYNRVNPVNLVNPALNRDNLVNPAPI